MFINCVCRIFPGPGLRPGPGPVAVAPGPGPVAVAGAVAVAGGGGQNMENTFFHFLTTYAENNKDYKVFLSGRVPKRVRFRVRPL